MSIGTQSYRFEASDSSLSPIARVKGPERAFSRSPITVSMCSNFQFHVISLMDILHLWSVYSVGRR